MKMVRFRRRLKIYGLAEDGGHNTLRESGRPCSCTFCDPHKWGKDGMKPKFRDLRRMAALLLLLPSLAFGQCYQSGNIIRPYGCDYIVELPPIVQGGPVTRCYTLDPQSTNIQPGLVSVQSSGCGPIAYNPLSYQLWDDTCGVLIASGSVFPFVSNPIAFLPDSSANYTLCFTLTPLCDSINAVCATYYFTTVPVELLDFGGDREGNGVRLRWMCGNESATSHFSVRRSTDAASWRLVGVVGAAGWSQGITTYTMIDRSPVQGVNYYDLSQVDIDGRVHHFRTIAVNFDGDGGSFLRWYNLAGQMIRHE